VLDIEVDGNQTIPSNCSKHGQKLLQVTSCTIDQDCTLEIKWKLVCSGYPHSQQNLVRIDFHLNNKNKGTILPVLCHSIRFISLTYKRGNKSSDNTEEIQQYFKKQCVAVPKLIQPARHPKEPANFANMSQLSRQVIRRLQEMDVCYNMSTINWHSAISFVDETLMLTKDFKEMNNSLALFLGVACLYITAIKLGWKTDSQNKMIEDLRRVCVNNPDKSLVSELNLEECPLLDYVLKTNLEDQTTFLEMCGSQFINFATCTCDICKHAHIFQLVKVALMAGAKTKDIITILTGHKIERLRGTTTWTTSALAYLKKSGYLGCFSIQLYGSDCRYGRASRDIGRIVQHLITSPGNLLWKSLFASTSPPAVLSAVCNIMYCSGFGVLKNPRPPTGGESNFPLQHSILLQEICEDM